MQNSKTRNVCDNYNDTLLPLIEKLYEKYRLTDHRNL